jgi:hypothetical protein
LQHHCGTATILTLLAAATGGTPAHFALSVSLDAPSVKFFGREPARSQKAELSNESVRYNRIIRRIFTRLVTTGLAKV